MILNYSKLNYKKIKELQLQKKVSNRKISKSIGMTDVGYGKMLDNKTCDVATLEAIARFFKVPVKYFFEEVELVCELNDPEIEYYICENCIEKQKKLDGAYELLKHKDNELIDYQRKYINLLEEMQNIKGNRNCG